MHFMNFKPLAVAIAFLLFSANSLFAQKPPAAVHAAFSQKFSNATDLLNTMCIRKTINGADFRLESTDYYETQVVWVGYNRKF
jgi:hypothetical protein